MSLKIDKKFEKDIQDYIKNYKNDKEKLSNIIKENESLFYTFYHNCKQYSNGMAKEDFIQIIYLKLLECIQSYDTNSNSPFFSYFYYTVKNTFFLEGRNLTLDESIPAEEKQFERIDNLVALQQIVGSLNDRDKKDFDMLCKVYYYNKTQTQVAEEYNISQCLVSRRIKRIKEKIKNKIL